MEVVEAWKGLVVELVAAWDLVVMDLEVEDLVVDLVVEVLAVMDLVEAHLEVDLVETVVDLVAVAYT